MKRIIIMASVLAVCAHVALEVLVVLPGSKAKQSGLIGGQQDPTIVNTSHKPVNTDLGAVKKKDGAKQVYLTFDDGPTPGYTAEVLGDLKAAGAHATFFEVGKHMMGEQDLMKAILQNGNQIGIHTWSHADLATVTWGETYNQIQQTRIQLTNETGDVSYIVRYPYFIEGPYGASVTKALHLGVAWSDISPEDWSATTSNQQIIATVMKHVFPGATIGLHDGNGPLPGPPGNRETPAYLPGLLGALKAAGYQFGVLRNASPTQ